MTLVTDSFGRLRMSSLLVSLLHLKDESASFYLGYDKERRSIALGPVGDVFPKNARPVTFDAKRHYASARSFFTAFGLPFECAKFAYKGTDNGWLMFERMN
ncbi:hypothetical protein [Fontibacillus phaseoli]|nr:hypothetical protein [Fontibacillus phaseoli]